MCSKRERLECGFFGCVVLWLKVSLLILVSIYRSMLCQGEILVLILLVVC